jgi:NTE family protein
MRIKDALRISFSIPLYFQPVFIDDAGTVQKQSKGETYHMMVDGGLLSNYPIHMFDSSRYIDDSAYNIYKQNNATLGLLLEKPEQLSSEHQSNYALSISSLKSYVTSVYQTIIDKPNPDIPTVQRTITISHLNIPGRVRKLPEPIINKLVESGRQGVREYFLLKKELE